MVWFLKFKFQTILKINFNGSQFYKKLAKNGPIFKNQVSIYIKFNFNGGQFYKK